MTSPSANFIVGIGASAGGLEALEGFFTHMPHHQDLILLVVQHLSPDYKSHMVELLAKHTPMPVIEAQDGIALEGGHIYLLPPRKNMTVFQGRVYLVDYERRSGLNLPIDLMLESLARDQGEHAIACILSGTGSDGTRGIRAIKQHGGMALAQDNSAKFDGMPRSAINTGLVDFIAPPADMPQIIERYISRALPLRTTLLGPGTSHNQDGLGKILAILRDHNDADFTGYKPNTLVRRIERRMTLFEIDSLEGYISYLQRSEQERTTLFKEFLIGVTGFFRDAEAFAYLQTEIIPQIMHVRDAQVRIWAPGCSTGEEAYSLAMLFQDHMERTGQFGDVKIFATDIDRDALDRASQGIYPESMLADISPAFIEKYFIKHGDSYEVSRMVRGKVVFAYQNLIMDPPFSRIDLVVCRNLLIYLQTDVQARILSTFEFALKPDGFLFLGSSESLGERNNNFVVENSKWKIYRYRGEYNPLENLTMNRVDAPRMATFRERPAPPTKPVHDWRANDLVLRSLVENVLPPCIVIDPSHQLVHAFGNLQPFLTAPRGYQVNLDIMQMIRPELSVPLSTALQRVFDQEEDVRYGGIVLRDEEQAWRAVLHARQFWDQGKGQRLAVVTFEREASTDIPPTTSEDFRMSDAVGQRIANLEQELMHTRQSLQHTIEELETSNEELQATNEELMAANEELQSTNEELESVNEELLTVNNEYQVKIKELGALNDDMNNLLKSIDIGTVFLDNNLRVRKFTPAAQATINLLEQDIGRPIDHFAHKFLDFDLIGAIREVLDTLVTAEYDVRTSTGDWLLTRIAPYRTHANQINGAVLTMVDITELKETTQRAVESSQFSQVILNSLAAQIAVIDHDGTITHVNDAWRRFSTQNGGSPHTDDVGTNYLAVCQLATGLNTEGASESYAGLRALLDGEIDEFTMEYPCHAPHEQRWFSLRAVPLKGDRRRAVVSHINITQNKQIENALRRGEKRLKLALAQRPITIFEHDLTFRYTWLQIAGDDYPGPDSQGCTDADLLPEADAAHLTHLKQECLRRREPTHHIVTLDWGGAPTAYDMTLEPLLDTQGRVVGLTGTYTRHEKP